MVWSARTGPPEQSSGTGGGALAARHDGASHTLSPRCHGKLSSCFTEPEFSGVWGTEVAGGSDAMRMSEVFS